MAIERRAFPGNPSHSAIDAVTRIGRAIAPDDPQIADWFRRYRSNHTVRIAEDVDLTHEHVQQGASILEIGAAPYLLTGAL